MKSQSRYRGYLLPPEIISHAVWLYHRFCLSFRDIEDMLAERGVIVSYESIRKWCLKFGPTYAKTLCKRQRRLGDTWNMDEVTIITAQGDRYYLWRAVDQDNYVIDVVVQKRKDKGADYRAEASHQHTRQQERQMR